MAEDRALHPADDRAVAADAAEPVASAVPASIPSVLPERLRSCIYEGPRSAVFPLAAALEIEASEALTILRAIVDCGFVIAPREPTDAMLVAYFDAYGARPQSPNSVIRGIGKARLRWREMGRAGTAVALSRRCYAPPLEARSNPPQQKEAGEG